MENVLIVMCFLVGLVLLGMAFRRPLKSSPAERAWEEEVKRQTEIAQVHAHLANVWKGEFEVLATTVADAVKAPEGELRTRAQVALKDAKNRLELQAERLRAMKAGVSR